MGLMRVISCPRASHSRCPHLTMSKPVRQDYIAKVRYQNSLPPPPLNPKFLKYGLTEPTSQKREGEQLMLSLFRKENFKTFIAHPDEEFGMHLNPINNPGYLDEDDSLAISGSQQKEVTLHDDDRELLRDAGISQMNKKELEVSFLRRTEYISEKLTLPQLAASDLKQKNEEDTDPASQLQMIEESFDRAHETLHNLEKLHHPRRKQLKAKATWPLLPDTAQSDSKFLNVKFIGLALIMRELGNKYDEHRNQLELAIFRPITLPDGEWISLFEVEADQADDLKLRLHLQEKEQPERLDEHTYTFKHHKNYDVKFTPAQQQNEELAIKFATAGPKSTKRKCAYYYPIKGRVDLKKYRALTNTEINKFLAKLTMDQINFTLREPSTDELKKIDAVRSEYDPMEYEAEDDEEDDLSEHLNKE